MCSEPDLDHICGVFVELENLALADPRERLVYQARKLWRTVVEHQLVNEGQ